MERGTLSVRSIYDRRCVPRFRQRQAMVERLQAEPGELVFDQVLMLGGEGKPSLANRY